MAAVIRLHNDVIEGPQETTVDLQARAAHVKISQRKASKQGKQGTMTRLQHTCIM